MLFRSNIPKIGEGEEEGYSDLLSLAKNELLQETSKIYSEVVVRCLDTKSQGEQHNGVLQDGIDSVDLENKILEDLRILNGLPDFSQITDFSGLYKS